MSDPVIPLNLSHIIFGPAGLCHSFDVCLYKLYNMYNISSSPEYSHLLLRQHPLPHHQNEVLHYPPMSLGRGIQQTS